MKAGLLILSIFIISILSLSCVSSNEKTMLKKGDQLPVFELQDQDGELYKIQEIIGKKNLVIYFYPKDDTPGCTKEACKFRDDFEVFTDLNALVIGISGDTPDSHKKFQEKYQLPFTLLSDPDDKVRQLFGVKGSLGGLIPGRVTFVVDRNGMIQYTFDSMSKAEQHVEEARKILEDLKKNQ